MNELLLVLSVVVIFGAVLVAYVFFGKVGLYCVSVMATVLANIEVKRWATFCWPPHF